MRVFSKFKIFYKISLLPPKKLKKPAKSEILIFDYEGTKPLEPIVSSYTYTSLAIRGEFINLPCLFFCLLNYKFWKSNAMEFYINKYISMVSPKVIITFIDNDYRFYEISGRFPEIKTIFVQNGIRLKGSDIFGALKTKNYHVDYKFVFNKAVGDKYSNYITGKTIILGSLKNNFVAISKNVLKNTVIFVSDYSYSETRTNIESNKAKRNLEMAYLADKLILEFLEEWCIKNKKVLKICGREERYKQNEIKFYSDIFKKQNWEYLPRSNMYSSYEFIDTAEIVVAAGSTLGIESLARGKRTAIFWCRQDFHDFESVRFGWPASIPSSGSFWTNSLDVANFHTILDYLNNCSNEQWKFTKQKWIGNLMEYDPYNSKLQNLLDHLLI